MANFALTGQPFQITREWSERSVVVRPEPAQWACAGGRADLVQQNGCADIAEDLKDVNLDLYLVLFPLKIVPPVEVELPHRTRAGSTIRSGRSFSPKGS